MIMSLLGRLPIPQRLVGFALTAAFFVLALFGLAKHSGRLSGVDKPLPSSSLRSHQQQSFVSNSNNNNNNNAYPGPHQPLKNIMVEPRNEVGPINPADHTPEHQIDPNVGPASTQQTNAYYVFLQKFPLESSFKMLFHTEVIVCPREIFEGDAQFLSLLDSLVYTTLSPSRFVDDNKNIVVDDDATKSPFVEIEKEQWSKQSVAGCTQLGYGGANCGSSCCGSPHRLENRNYALNSNQAVISNAMGEYKELYFYGLSGGSTTDEKVVGISGDDAYKAVCHGHMNAIEMGSQPKCQSNWAGRDYNPLTNNCNTFTSSVLKCVYGFSDAKPQLGMSDMVTVSCPTETSSDGRQVDQCVIPSFEIVGGEEEEDIAKVSI